MSEYTFMARSYPWRLHSGAEAIERQLETEVVRERATRAFVICSRSIEQSTTTLARVRDALGDAYAGAYSGIEKDSTYRSVAEATAEARAAGADLLIAIGGGSVIVAARAVDVFLSEEGDPFDLMTQYPPGQPAYSPRLMAKKLPIINIPVTPTSAMNRAGTGLKNDDLDHRMEYFDPKTRPVALFWDEEALLSTPVSLLRSTATTTFAGAISSAASPANPLVDADRRHAVALVAAAYPRVMEEPPDAAVRFDLCAAAFLANRAADDGASGDRAGNPFAGNYALATAIHVRYPTVGQGESTCVFTATVARQHAPNATIEQSRRVADALQIWRDGMSAEEATLEVADTIEASFRAVGMPTRVGELGIPREDIPLIASETVKNFNFNPDRRSDADQVQRSIDLLEAAW